MEGARRRVKACQASITSDAALPNQLLQRAVVFCLWQAVNQSGSDQPGGLTCPSSICCLAEGRSSSWLAPDWPGCSSRLCSRGVDCPWRGGFSSAPSCLNSPAGPLGPACPSEPSRSAAASPAAAAAALLLQWQWQDQCWLPQGNLAAKRVPSGHTGPA